MEEIQWSFTDKDRIGRNNRDLIAAISSDDLAVECIIASIANMSLRKFGECGG